MKEKTFKILSNAEEFLTAEEIALALLKHVTLTPKNTKVAFGVMEVGDALPAKLEYECKLMQ